MRNILLTIAYDGTDFAGWQRQPRARTVQGDLERALAAVCGGPVAIEGTSRTDAGVHALAQRATLRGDFAIPTERIPVAVNGLLASGEGPMKIGAIRVTAAEDVPEGFHARFSATGKTYRYRIEAGPAPDPFERNRAWFLERELDCAAMSRAAECLIGTHDFKAFQAAGGNEVPSTVKTIRSIDVAERFSELPCGPDGAPRREQHIRLEFTGSGFLYKMVRNLVGTLVEIGGGKRPPEEMKAILESLDRTKAGPTAPPQGLYLKEIYYDHE
jgi:tRNA pseudouridine38-40 synthase